MVKANYAGGASGALSGAASGAAIGSAVPGIGTAIGAGVGGLIGGVSGLFGGGGSAQKKSTLSKTQKGLLKAYNQAIMTGEGPLADVFGSGDVEGLRGFYDRNVREPSLQKFREDVVPAISGQFRGRGLGKSSYLGESLSRAGRDVQTNLDNRFSDMVFQQQEAGRGRKASAINSIMGNQEFAYNEPSKGLGSTLLESIAPAAGEFVGNYFGEMGKNAARPSATAGSPQQFQPYQANIQNLPKFGDLPYGGAKRASMF